MPRISSGAEETTEMRSRPARGPLAIMLALSGTALTSQLSPMVSSVVGSPLYGLILLPPHTIV